MRLSDKIHKRQATNHGKIIELYKITGIAMLYVNIMSGTEYIQRCQGQYIEV